MKNKFIFICILTFMLGDLIAVSPLSAKPFIKPTLCPSSDPELFMKTYSDSIDLQRKFIVLPLRYTYIVNNPSSAEFLKEKTIIANDIFQIPYVTAAKPAIFPSSYVRDKEKLIYKISTKLNRMTVDLYQPDTDYINLFNFVFKNKCWTLESINSKSI